MAVLPSVCGAGVRGRSPGEWSEICTKRNWCWRTGPVGCSNGVSSLASVGSDTDIDTYVNVTPDNDNTNDYESDNSALRFYPGYTAELFSDTGVLVNAATYRYIRYDPTNGTVSNGDVFRLSDLSGQ